MKVEQNKPTFLAQFQLNQIFTCMTLSFVVYIIRSIYFYTQFTYLTYHSLYLTIHIYSTFLPSLPLEPIILSIQIKISLSKNSKNGQKSQNCQKKNVNYFMNRPFKGFILLFQPFNCQKLFLKHLKYYIIFSAWFIQVLCKHLYQLERSAQLYSTR